MGLDGVPMGRRWTASKVVAPAHRSLMGSECLPIGHPSDWITLTGNSWATDGWVAHGYKVLPASGGS